MSISHLLKGAARKRGGWNGRQQLAYGGLCFGAVLLVVLSLTFLFRGAILNRYGKWKLERTFSEAHPGCELRLGRLVYALGANRLVAQSVTLSTKTSTLKIGRASLTGVDWPRLLWGSGPLVQALARASLEATNLDAVFPQALYLLHCSRLRASVPGAYLIAAGSELQPLVGDEAFFAAHTFRTTRYHLVVPECRVLGLTFRELLQGKGCRVRSIRVSSPLFDALVNRDKAVEPFSKPPLMVNEALAAIRQPVRVDSLTIANGDARYGERMVAGGGPGVLTFGNVSVSVEGLANRVETSSAILLRAQGDFMHAGLLRVLMTLPVASPDFSLHYSGSLSAMDLTRLNAFLDIAEHTRVKSGNVREAAFEIEVKAGLAIGIVRATYGNLSIAVLDRKTGTERGLDNRVASFLVNLLTIRSANAPNGWGSMKEGKADYRRKPDDEFLQFVWFALRSGVLDVISH